MKKDERNKYCVIVHTHPPGCDGMSETDYNMVYGWCLAIGAPVYYIIITGNIISCWCCQKESENRLIWSFDYLNVSFESTSRLLFLILFSNIMYGISKTKDKIDSESELELKNNIDFQGTTLNDSEFNIWSGGQ
jgi:hypothetical protein